VSFYHSLGKDENILVTSSDYLLKINTVYIYVSELVKECAEDLALLPVQIIYGPAKNSSHLQNFDLLLLYLQRKLHR